MDDLYAHFFKWGKYIGITKTSPEKRWLNGNDYTKRGKRKSPMFNAHIK